VNSYESSLNSAQCSLLFAHLQYEFAVGLQVQNGDKRGTPRSRSYRTFR